MFKMKLRHSAGIVIIRYPQCKIFFFKDFGTYASSKTKEFDHFHLKFHNELC